MKRLGKMKFEGRGKVWKEFQFKELLCFILVSMHETLIAQWCERVAIGEEIKIIIE